jgi:multidrug transporter EmrE-like cation transporter
MDNLLLLTAVFLLALSQVLQKQGAVSSLRGRRTPRDFLRAFLSPPLLLAVIFIVAGTVLWLIVLYRMDLSRAYPFLGLGTVLVVALSRLWLNEHVSLFRWLGVGLIAAGISLVAGT